MGGTNCHVDNCFPGVQHRQWAGKVQLKGTGAPPCVRASPSPCRSRRRGEQGCCPGKWGLAHDPEAQKSRTDVTAQRLVLTAVSGFNEGSKASATKHFSITMYWRWMDKELSIITSTIIARFIRRMKGGASANRC